jgi:hypothetical protein
MDTVHWSRSIRARTVYLISVYSTGSLLRAVRFAYGQDYPILYVSFFGTVMVPSLTFYRKNYRTLLR